MNLCSVNFSYNSQVKFDNEDRLASDADVAFPVVRMY